MITTIIATVALGLSVFNTWKQRQDRVVDEKYLMKKEFEAIALVRAEDRAGIVAEYLQKGLSEEDMMIGLLKIQTLGGPISREKALRIIQNGKALLDSKT